VVDFFLFFWLIIWGYGTHTHSVYMICHTGELKFELTDEYKRHLFEIDCRPKWFNDDKVTPPPYVSYRRDNVEWIFDTADDLSLQRLTTHYAVQYFDRYGVPSCPPSTLPPTLAILYHTILYSYYIMRVCDSALLIVVTYIAAPYCLLHTVSLPHFYQPL